MNSFPTLFDPLEHPTSIYIAYWRQTQILFTLFSPKLYELINSTVPMIYLSIYNISGAHGLSTNPWDAMMLAPSPGSLHLWKNFFCRNAASGG